MKQNDSVKAGRFATASQNRGKAVNWTTIHVHMTSDVLALDGYLVRTQEQGIPNDTGLRFCFCGDMPVCHYSATRVCHTEVVRFVSCGD